MALMRSPVRKGRGVSIALAAMLAGHPSSAGAQVDPAPVSRRVLEYFEDACSAGLDDYLEGARPRPLPVETRSEILAQLPEEGAIEPSDDGKRKLAHLARIFRYHDRAGMVEIKVISIRQAFVGFHSRCVVLISNHALRLLNVEELQALVAHEMGHEYFWDEYALASRQKQSRRLQELELRCDGLAVLTLANLGLSPQHLISGVAKLNRFNARFGPPLNRDSFVSEEERARFIKAVARLLDLDCRLKSSPSGAYPNR